MNIEEARLYLEHTSKDDFNLEEHQKVNRYEAIQVVLQEIERLNNIINELEEYIKPFLYMLNGITDRDVYEQCQLDDFSMIMDKLQELKGSNIEILDLSDIQKLNIIKEKNCHNNWKWKLSGYNISTPQKIIADKINEIIDYVKEK